MIFESVLKQDYDSRVSIAQKNLLCYSKKKLKALHPDGDFRVVGEACSTRAAKKAAENASKPPKNPPIGEYTLDEGTQLSVFTEGTKNGFFYKRAGFVCVGESEYLAILTSRTPFLLSLLGVLIAFGVALGVILSLSGEGGIFGPPVITPNHPLPPEDVNSRPIEGDGDEKLETEEGGGAVSMIYTAQAKLHLSTKKINVYFLNPYRSSHDVVFHLSLVSGDERIRIASSGRLVPGKGLLIMEYDVRSATLSEGVYEGVYEVYFYDHETGERAVIASEIKDITVSVFNE